MIYHDLRSPLANVVSSLDVLASMLPQEGEAIFTSLLNIAVRSTERIQRLTNSLLDINRLEAGQPIGDRQPVAPHALANDAVDAVLPVARNKNIGITIGVPAELPLVSVDSDMIRRVLVNLVENAIKFTPPQGKIHVGARQDGNYVTVWVEDTGPGIPIPEQERIFDKFTRLDTKERARGLGLGLAFCRLAVIGHGGRIWVESEPGSGASFIFTLPIASVTKV
jgi:signal transduction histidine kinase